jgi:hypothetical protein
VSKRNILIPVVAGIASTAALGTLAYVLTRLAQSGIAPRSARADAQRESLGLREQPELRESMVVARSAVPDPLEVDLDLDGVFRSPAEIDLDEATARGDVKVPPLASADDAEPSSPDALGAYWLSRATQSEHSFSEGDLDIDLENVADVRDGTEPDEYEHDDEELTAPNRAQRA